MENEREKRIGGIGKKEGEKKRERESKREGTDRYIRTTHVEVCAGDDSSSGKQRARRISFQVHFPQSPSARYRGELAFLHVLPRPTRRGPTREHDALAVANLFCGFFILFAGTLALDAFYLRSIVASSRSPRCNDVLISFYLFFFFIIFFFILVEEETSMVPLAIGIRRPFTSLSSCLLS